MNRNQIFALASRKLRAEFDELSTIPHNALKGHEAEDIVRRFLKDHLPRRFDVGSGFILDPTGEVSKQTDVVIYDAFNCPIYRASPDAAIFPSNNVAAVIEVKSRLTKAELEDAAQKSAAVKALKKSKPQRGPHFSQTYCAVFAFSAEAKLSTLLENYRSTIATHGLGHHIDLVCVIDKGILSLAVQPPGHSGWGLMFMEGFGGTAAEGAHLAASAGSFGEHSLDVFFRLLLMPLMMFRSIVDHPGFDWSSIPSPEDRQLISYITSITNETNPKRRKQKLEKYAQQVRESFEKGPSPDEWKGD